MNTEARFEKLKMFKKYANPNAIMWSFGLAQGFWVFVAAFFICTMAFGFDYKNLIYILIGSSIIYFLAWFPRGRYKSLQRKETKQFLEELHEKREVSFKHYEFSYDERLDRLLIFDGYLIATVTDTNNCDKKSSETCSLFLEKKKNLLIVVRTQNLPSGQTSDQRIISFDTLEEIRTKLGCNSIEKKLYESAGIPHMVYFQP